MIITLDQRLFQPDLPALLRGLQFVFAANARNHVLLIDPGWDADDTSHPVQIWLDKLPPAIRDAVEMELERGLDEAANMSGFVAQVRVELIASSIWEDGKLTPGDALRLMQTPLWLVLENGRNDLHFLRRILDKNDRMALDEHLGDGRVEVPIGGGTGELQWFLETLATLPPMPSLARDTTSWIRRLRSWVMFDRDAHPRDLCMPSKTSMSLRNLCAGMTKPRPFPGHQLGRRTIENYLPFEALDRWADHGKGAEGTQRRQRVEAFKSSDFSKLRRACFAMKDGFVKDVAQPVREEFKNRRSKQRKVNGRWIPQDRPRTAYKSRTRGRWLAESELPVVFQGLRNSAFRDRLNYGFGGNIAELYADNTLGDACFYRVFDEDPAAAAWRNGLVESLWAVL